MAAQRMFYMLKQSFFYAMMFKELIVKIHFLSLSL